ncbi:MAG: hypothetical protein FWH01_10700, partial [Oscillospiraceae bacterium]|nr:hypothetical protein [Oscillospiraceae bacterium]
KNHYRFIFGKTSGIENICHAKKRLARGFSTASLAPALHVILRRWLFNSVHDCAVTNMARKSIVVDTIAA